MKKVKIGIGSTNPVKVKAVQEAITQVWKALGQEQEFELISLAVPSGVSDQPFSDEETLTGARNRAQAVLAANAQIEIAFGVEGGVFETEEGIFSTVWVCVQDQTGRRQETNGLRFLLPERVAAGLRQGKELGHVMDELTGQTNIKHGEGMLGVLTGGVLGRGDGYRHLATIAFARYCYEFGAQ